MELPAQIRKQVEAVNALHAELIAENASEVDTTEPEHEGEGAVVASGQAYNAAEDAPVPRRQAEGGKDEEATYEKRYRSLQGMFNAEVPRLRAEKQALAQRVQQLEQLIATVDTAPTNQSQPPAETLVTAEDIEEYGDSIDVMRRVYRDEVSAQQARVNQLEQQVRQMQATVVPRVHQLSHDQTVSEAARFWADLQSVVPDWEEVNSNPDFHAWLLEIDPLTGVNRQTYLEDAQRSLNARRAAAFFNAWKDASGMPGAHTNRTAKPSQLELQMAPGRGRSGATRTSSEPKTYSNEDIKAFFADVTKGKYAGRKEERDRIERDIFRAQKAGRIDTT